ncbi:MAG: 16S rRNA (uracil(1498)-N(3))-methyltransferase [Cocleimonas sp.]|nr:16S rRNA (uracil(1498)-N(3))-methyltransferase [Cocleimonas sp.]
MKTSRFFQQCDMCIGEELALSAENHRHAIQVLRLKNNQNLIIFNGVGGEYQAKLILADKRKSRVLIESFDSIARESPLIITLVLATIKPDKMDFAIQKAVELGVTKIQPVYTKRSVIKIKENRLEKKIHHWQGVIIAACEQSGRTAIPELHEPINLDQFLYSVSGEMCIAMLPGDHPKINTLKDIEGKQGVMLLVGPEGGFTNEEEQIMMEKGVAPISFGSRILRAETAVVAGLTACQQRWGDL